MAEDKLKVVPRKSANSRTKNRFREHTLESRLLQPLAENSKPDVLLFCIDPGCDYRGWFDKSELIYGLRD